MRLMAVGVLLACAACSREAASPDATAPRVSLAIVNAKVWTGDPARPWVEALAASGDRVTLTGSSAEIRRAAGGAEIVDAAGRLADLVMLDRNIFEIPPEEIRNVRVMLTMIGGKVVYRRPTT